MPVERDSGFILRLDDECEGFHVSFYDPQGSIGKECAFEPAAMKALVGRKPADACSRQ